ncbi:Ser/Thr protein phosphatase family protein, partial [Basidiobolus meristosporus CBS 931.73]
DRLVVVGDLHGSLEYFDDLLKKIDFNPKFDRVVLAGDMTFKGPDSLGVLRRAKEIGAGCVRGNHDHSLLEWKNFLRKLSPTDTPSEYEFPADLTLTQYYPIAAEMDQELYDYLQSCPIILSVPKYSVYVMHAGVDPSRPMESQDPNVVMNIKNILADGTPTRGKFVGENWSVAWNAKQKKSKNPSTIVYGHQASLGLNIKEYSKGLDTGCVYGGQLTAMIFPGEHLVSVNC